MRRQWDCSRLWCSWSARRCSDWGRKPKGCTSGGVRQADSRRALWREFATARATVEAVLRFENCAPVAQLDRASGYEPAANSIQVVASVTLTSSEPSFCCSKVAPNEWAQRTTTSGRNQAGMIFEFGPI